MPRSLLCVTKNFLLYCVYSFILNVGGKLYGDTTMLDNQKKFNYRDASEQEVLDHVLQSTHQAVQAAKAYYTRQGEKDVVKRINDARDKAKMIRLQLKIEESRNEIDGGNTNIYGE